jgi:two-component sensor histidine kinase
MQKLFFLSGLLGLVFTIGFAQTNEENKLDSLNAKKLFNKSFSNTGNSIKATGLIGIAESYEIKGELDSALSSYLSAKLVFENLQDTSMILKVNLRLVEFYRKYNQLGLAKNVIGDIQGFLNVYEASQDFLARYYNRLAAVESESSGDINKILEYSLKCIAIAKTLGDSSLIASSLNELGFRYENMFFNEKWKSITSRYFFIEADTKYKEALSIYRAKKQYRSELMVIINLARLYHHDDQPVQCLEYVKQGLAIPDEGFKPYAKMELYRYKGDNYRKLGRFEEAIEAKEKFHYLIAQYKEETYQKDFVELQTKYDVVKKESRIAEQELSLIKGEKNRALLITALITFFILMGVLFYLYKLSQGKNKQLKALVKENAFLVEESNHRTKNNLQLISSLIHRELIKKDDEFEINELTKVSSLIESISSLHKQLYLNKEKDKIDLSEFLHDVFDNLAYLLQQNSIGVKLNFPHTIIENKMAGYIGILITELCINSIKHAFSNSNKKQINCTITKEGDVLSIFYSDNGIGLPQNTSLDLVDLLCNQIKANYNIENKSTGFEIMVKVKL